MKPIFLYLCLCIFLSLNIFPQNSKDQNSLHQKQIQNQFEEIMRAREEMFKSLLNDDSFVEMNKRMEDMMKRFSGQDFNLGDQSFFGGAVVGEYDWREDEKSRVLMIKVKQIKDKPLDIKIEKGLIKIKGDVEEVSEDNTRKNKDYNKRISKIHFEREFTIPNDVDETNPEFENKAGELRIIFKKKIDSKLKKETKKNLNNKKENQNKEIDDIERKPIDVDKKEISI